MVAPPVEVMLSTGESVPLESLYRDRPLTLVFLRHFGCTFCREQVAELRFSSSLHVAFVGMGTVEETDAFRTRMRSPHPFICDPDKELYHAFGLGKGSISQVLGAKVFVRGFGATLRGHWVGLPIGDPWQLPGIFLIEPNGEISWEFRSQNASEVVRSKSLPPFSRQ